MQNSFDPVLAGIVRILDEQQRIVGTGFVISLFPKTSAWIMTSSKVIELATGLAINDPLLKGPSKKVRVATIFHIDPTEKQWQATVENWLGSAYENICVLNIEGNIPDKVRKLPLIRATHAEGRNVSIFGYPEEHHSFNGAWRYSEICRSGPKQIETRLIFLQLETRAMTDSYRGAPVWDDTRRRVLGIVTQVEHQEYGGLHIENTYAVPAEVIEIFHKDTLRESEITVEVSSPYHSNEPLTEGDAESFHGYDTVVDKLWDFLEGDRKLLVMLGPEKSGKTSVIQAGLIPRLKKLSIDDYPDWSIFKPRLSTNEPFIELDHQGLEGASQHLARSLHTWQQKHGSLKMLFILDQFENILRYCSMEKQQQFVSQVLQVIHEQAATVLLVVRDDCYSLLAKHEELMLQAEDNIINVFSPYKKEELISMARQRPDIPEALRKSEVLEQIYEKVTTRLSTSNEKHSSPIAQFESLFEQVYLQYQQQSLGENNEERDIIDIILDTLPLDRNDWAEQIFLNLGKEEQKFVHYLLMQMVLLGEEKQGIPDTKCYVPMEDLCDGDIDKYELLYALASKGLLITDRDRRTGKETITIAQDTLLSEWTRMRQWLDEKRHFLAWRQGLQPKLQKWQVDSMHTDDENVPSLLLQDLSLTEAIQWSALYAHCLNTTEMLFIETSRSYQQKKDTEQFIKLYKDVSKDVNRQQEEKDKRRLTFLARHLAKQARQIYEKHPQLLQQSVLLAATSLSLFPSPDADQILRQGLALLPRVEKCIPTRADIFEADFSYNGHYVAVASDQDIEITDLRTGNACFLFSHKTKVVAIAFSPDGQCLVTADDNGVVQAWFLADQQALYLYQKASALRITFSPGGRYMAVCHWDNEISSLVVWDCTRWHQVYEETRPEQIHSIVFSADDNIFVSGYVSGTVEMYNLSHKKVFFKQDHKKRMSIVTLSSSAHYLAIAYEDGEVTVCKLQVPGVKDHFALYSNIEGFTTQEISSQKYKGRIRKMLFSPSSTHLIIADNDASVSVWEFVSNAQVKVQTLLHNRPVYKLALSHDGSYLATASEDQMVRIWEVHTGQEITRLVHGQYIENIAFSLERHYLFTAGDDRTVRVWDTIKSNQCMFFTCGCPVHSVAWRPDLLELAVCDASDCVKIWRIERGHLPQVKLQLFQKELIQYLVYSPNGRYIATRSDKAVIVWNAESGEKIYTLSLRNTHSQSLTFGPDSNLLAIGSSTSITLWEMGSGQLKASHQYEEQIRSIIFHPSKNFLAIGFEHGTVCLWYWEKVKDQLALFSLGSGSVGSGSVGMMTFSPDGYSLATASEDGFAYAWEWETEKDKILFEFPHGGGVHVICFSPDGRFIATASTDYHAYLWNASDGLLQRKLLHKDAVGMLVFSPDGLYLATTGDGNNVSIWNAATGNKIASLFHDDFVSTIAFSSDGKFLATGCKDGTVKSWMWQPKDLIQDVCRRVTHHLTPAEWQEYAGKDEPYYKLTSALL